MAKPPTDEAGSSCHIHLSLWDATARTNVFDADGDRQRSVPLVPRRMDGACRRLHGVLRPHGQLLQALRGRLVGADPHRLVARQPHRRLPRGRQRPEPADREPDPRRRLQSVPGLRRVDRQRPGRDRATDRTARPRSTATSTRPRTCARVPVHPRAGGRRVRVPARSPRQPSATTSSSTTPTSTEVEVDAFNAAVTDWERARYFERI